MYKQTFREIFHVARVLFLVLFGGVALIYLIFAFIDAIQVVLSPNTASSLDYFNFTLISVFLVYLVILLCFKLLKLFLRD